MIFLTSDWLKDGRENGETPFFCLKKERKDVPGRDEGGLNRGEKDGIVTASVELVIRRDLVTFGGVRLP